MHASIPRQQHVAKYSKVALVEYHVYSMSYSSIRTLLLNLQGRIIYARHVVSLPLCFLFYAFPIMSKPLP